MFLLTVSLSCNFVLIYLYRARLIQLHDLQNDLLKAETYLGLYEKQIERLERAISEYKGMIDGNSSDN